MSSPWTQRVRNKSLLAAVVPLIGGLWACSGGDATATGRTSSATSGANAGNTNDSGAASGTGTTGTGGAANATTDATTTTTAGGGTPTGTTGTDSGPVNFDLNCAQAEVGAPALRLLTRQEVENTLNDIFPEVIGQWQSSLPANQISAAGFDNATTNTVGNQLAERLLETAESVASAITGGPLANMLPCSTTAPDRSCASQFLSQYGTRLFRRPLSAAEAERYLTFYDTAAATADFATAIKWIAVGLIQSPAAVYRSEIGTDTGSGTRQLTPYELATELAYTYTSAPPDQQLLDSAAAGSLGDLPTLATNLLLSERGKQTVQRFFEGYLGYTPAASKQKPAVVGFDTAKLDMLAETRAFIDSVILQGGGGVRELLTSPTTNPSSALASFYGLPAPAAEFASVQRPAGQGVGVLAQGSFLAAHANADASSPTQRGVFAFMRLLCQPKPPLPDDVPDLAPPAPGVQTTRQRYEQAHATTPLCANCHSLFDPIGFGFEHFDEAGRYRDQEAGLPIDATGTVRDAAAGELFSFDGLDQLMAGLTDQAIVYQCFSAYLATYAFGTTESCLGPSQAAALEAGSLGITQAFANLAAEPHFTTRAAQ